VILFINNSIDANTALLTGSKANTEVEIMPLTIAQTGINAGFSRLRTTANNIANSSTTGFKQSRTETVESAGGGVKVARVAEQPSQGLNQTTGNSTDLSIQGNGFFRLNDHGETVYSRDGQFQIDSDGYVSNSRGQRLTGFNANENGIIDGSVKDLRLSSDQLQPSATTEVSINANFNANNSVPTTSFDPSDASSYNNRISMDVVDSLGVSHQADIYFRETTGSNQMEAMAYIGGKQVLAPTAIEFSTSGGLISPMGGEINIPAFDPGTGADNMNISLDLSDATRYASDFSLNQIKQNGQSAGQNRQIQIDQNGVVSSLAANGESQVIGQVALADFSNPQGLGKLGDNTYAATYGSGDAFTAAPGTGNLGQINAGSLEESNVSLQDQLIDMKLSQYDIEANVKVLQAADEMMGSLINIKA